MLIEEAEREVAAEKNGTAYFPGPSIAAVRGKKAHAEQALIDRRNAPIVAYSYKGIHLRYSIVGSILFMIRFSACPRVLSAHSPLSLFFSRDPVLREHVLIERLKAAEVKSIGDIRRDLPGSRFAFAQLSMSRLSINVV
jgi:hypothetical protein